MSCSLAAPRVIRRQERAAYIASDCVSALANIERSRSATVERSPDDETLNSCFRWRFNENNNTTAGDASDGKTVRDGGMVIGTAANATTAAECQMACRLRSDCRNFSFTSTHNSGETSHTHR